MKRLKYLLFLFCLLPLTMQAQEENKGISAQKERKFKLINPIDTNYIAPNQYNLVFRLEQSTWQENFKISSKSIFSSLKKHYYHRQSGGKEESVRKPDSYGSPLLLDGKILSHLADKQSEPLKLHLSVSRSKLRKILRQPIRHS